jgi:hypothetical protein
MARDILSFSELVTTLCSGPLKIPFDIICTGHKCQRRWLATYLQRDADIDQQGPAMHGRDAVPGPVPLELQPAEFVREEQRQDADVVVSADAEDEVGPRAGRVVAESGMRGALSPNWPRMPSSSSSSRSLAIARRIVPSLTRWQPSVYSCRRPLLKLNQASDESVVSEILPCHCRNG